MSAPTRRSGRAAEQRTCHHPAFCDLHVCDYTYRNGDVRHASTPVVVATDDDATISMRLERDDEHLVTGDLLPSQLGVALYIDNQGAGLQSQAYFELDSLDHLLAALQDHREQLVAAMRAEAVR